MFREMRRKKQLLTPEESAAVLHRGTSGVLALAGDDGYPYAVPMSYVYDGAKLYFHCAKSGHKLDAIRRNCKASFCVIDQDQIVPEEYTSHFRSVIEALALKYAPDDDAADRNRAIDQEWAPLCMLELTIDHITGKEAIELVKAKRPSEQ